MKTFKVEFTKDELETTIIAVQHSQYNAEANVYLDKRNKEYIKKLGKILKILQKEMK